MILETQKILGRTRKGRFKSWPLEFLELFSYRISDIPNNFTKQESTDRPCLALEKYWIALEKNGFSRSVTACLHVSRPGLITRVQPEIKNG